MASIIASSSQPGDAPDPGNDLDSRRGVRDGSDNHYSEEAPAHEVTVDGFWMDTHTVTNEESSGV